MAKVKKKIQNPKKVLIPHAGRMYLLLSHTAGGNANGVVKFQEFDHFS
jgi:hypothetical protein